ncbi:mitochondrial carrier protein [Striga asiatica]|uniref:Mitochondrial carrier protein n=1 Tax=Striga asiatica TaxID=4170 RepID=A0A5A7P9U9_STRAF|nr:mitochondrial carrier protein [Striga asiatica]
MISGPRDMGLAARNVENKPFVFLGVLYESAVAGAAAGAVVEAVLYPIDTIKTRLQAVSGGSQIVLKGLYSGLAGNLAGVIPASALFVGVYEPTKQKLLKIIPENFSAVAHLVNLFFFPCFIFLFGLSHKWVYSSGYHGSLHLGSSVMEFMVIKQRIQTGQFASAPEAARLIVAKEGFRGLYAGFGSFLLRDLPFDAIQFCIYEQLRIGYKLADGLALQPLESNPWKMFQGYINLDVSLARRDLNDPENAIIGAFAGAITGAMTTPLDVIKTRLMIQVGSKKQYNGIVHCINTILKEEGSSAFLRGMGARVVWIGIGGSIFFGVLEKSKQLLARRHPLKED